MSSKNLNLIYFLSSANYVTKFLSQIILFSSFFWQQLCCEVKRRWLLGEKLTHFDILVFWKTKRETQMSIIGSFIVDRGAI